MNKKDYKTPQEMTEEELKEWIAWAVFEKDQYDAFIDTLKQELKKRLIKK